ncbi:MAG: ComEC/Rec2 family competence protein [Clostridia bacterium]|nr:ComEC/Rec2 family competence protein [Clostridia bacterium]
MEKVGERFGNPILKLGYFLRNAITYRMNSIAKDSSLELFKTMIYGEDIELEENIASLFDKNGITHMLSVSGMHMTYLLMVVGFIVKGKRTRTIVGIYGIILILFTVISGLSISVIRACIMSLLVVTQKYKKQKVNRYFNITIAFLYVLIINPYSIFNLGCIMSFLSTLGIISFYQFIYSYFDTRFSLNIVTKFIVSTISLNLSSLAMILPVQVYFSGSFELISVLSNLVVSVLLSFQFLIGFFTLFCIFIPYISHILVFSNITSLRLILQLLEFMKDINYLTISIPRQSLFEIFSYYLLLGIFSYKKYIPALFDKKNKNIVRNIAFLLTILIVLYNISMYIYRVYFEEYIYFFNVGQGNMAIIRKNRKIMVVDIGSTSKNLASNILSNFLKAKAIHKIDAVFFTHLHDDHINGMAEIIEKVVVKEVYYSIPKKGEDVIEKLLIANNIPRKIVSRDEEITIGKIKVKVLSPPDEKTIIAEDSLNANSLILLVNTNSKKILFMGDATIESERELLKHSKMIGEIKNIDAIQIGHHGSNTSSGADFLANINACTAVISSKKEKFGHPNKETIDKLNRFGFDIKITELSGAIKLK